MCAWKKGVGKGGGGGVKDDRRCRKWSSEWQQGGEEAPHPGGPARGPSSRASCASPGWLGPLLSVGPCRPACRAAAPALQGSCPAAARPVERPKQAPLRAPAAASPAAPSACSTCLAARLTTTGGGRPVLARFLLAPKAAHWHARRFQRCRILVRSGTLVDRPMTASCWLIGN